jgi:hypothetical protein
MMQPPKMESGANFCTRGNGLMQQAMKIEQMVLEKLRSLPLEKQQEVLDFA